MSKMKAKDESNGSATSQAADERANPQSAAPAPPRPREEESIKETFESIVIAFILAFVFRAYVVEAFVIPTGSMAPTLLGQHMRVRCQECGYGYTVDPARDGPADGITEYYCPMCHFPNRPAAGTRVSAGDRILVHKYLYSLSQPRRYDVVVFKSPPKPYTNYIKRLVGLPGQATVIIEGNVYYNAELTEPTEGWARHDGWRIARKTDPRQNPDAFKIQRTVWQPLYHSEYVPLDFPGHEEVRDDVWHVPWLVALEGGQRVGDWKTVERDLPDRFRQTVEELDPRDGFVHTSAKRGVIRFDFGLAWVGGPGYFPYSQMQSGGVPRHRGNVVANIDHAIEDVRVAATFQPDQEGLSARLRTTARLDDEAGVMRVLIAEVAADGTVRLLRKASVDATAEEPIGEAAQVEPFEAGKPRRVELWYVDQEASVWVDGERVLVEEFDLPMEALLSRPGPGELLPDGRSGAGGLRTPDIAIEVEGAPVSLHHVHVDRDLYYVQQNYYKSRDDPDTDLAHMLTGDPGRSLVVKDGEDGTCGGPVFLGADQFFCLGDNSPFSKDSRVWNSVNPWVLERSFEQELSEADAVGIVPRRLMMGKAFFVYFPAPYGMNPGAMPFFPNFGDMRFIH